MNNDNVPVKKERDELKKLVVQVYLIHFPESQRIMTHPEAQNVENSSSYIVPMDVWEKYKNTYYDEEISKEEISKAAMVTICNSGLNFTDVRATYSR